MEVRITLLNYEYYVYCYFACKVTTSRHVPFLRRSFFVQAPLVHLIYFNCLALDLMIRNQLMETYIPFLVELVKTYKITCRYD